MGLFSKKTRLSHITSVTCPFNNTDPLHHAKFQKNLMNQFQENLRTETGEPTDPTYFIGPFRLCPGVRQEKQ